MFDVLWRRLALAVLPLVPLLLWDASGLDLPLARLFGSAQGFARRSHPGYVLLLHEVPRALSMAALLALAWGAWRPWGFLRTMGAADRRQLAFSVALAMLSITALKRLATTSCPWDLAEFGGVAHYVSHWIWGVRDGGSGRCFPAGHASAGFAFLGGYFALRHKAPTAARWWLASALLAGFVLGAAQQVRGAHFMSHTLWTGWLCWTTGWLCDLAATALRPRFPHFASTATPTDSSPA